MSEIVKTLNKNIQYLKKYFKYIKKLKKNNQKINKINELLLSQESIVKYKYHFFNYHSQLIKYLSDEIKKENYIVNEDILIKILNKYASVNEYYYSYKELININCILYSLLINNLVVVLDCNLGDITTYTLRKEKKIYNICKSINGLNNINIENIINQVSLTEKILLSLDNYKELTLKSKKKYREIIEIKGKKNEYQYIKNILDMITKSGKYLEHYLFKQYNYSIINISIMIISWVISLILAILFGKYFPINYYFGILMLTLLNNKFIYKILTYLVPSTYLPQLERNNLPQSEKTMCVKYVILNDASLVNVQFDSLVSRYEQDKIANLHYTLFIDSTDSDHQIEPFDEEILAACLTKTQSLNEQYGSNIFHYAYRKRLQHQSDNMWYGYNRRNGAIEYFNKILLDKITEEEEYYLFYGHSNFDHDYKYVIEIDDLNNQIKSKDLLGILSHPINAPLYKDDKLINGYYMLTINNKKNSYGEGSYNENGIYSLEMYDKYLLDKMPNSLLHLNIGKCYNIKKVKKSYPYSTEALIKNEITTFIWCLKENNYFNLTKKIRIGKELINRYLNILTFILLIVLLVNNANPILYIYILLVTNKEIIDLPTNVFIGLKVLIKYIFSKKYRYKVLNINKVKYGYIYPINYIISLILLLLGCIFKWNMIIISLLVTLFIINGLVYYIYNNFNKEVK